MSDNSGEVTPKRRRRRYQTRWYLRNKKRLDALAKELEGRADSTTDEEFRKKDETLHDCSSKRAETLKVESVDFHYDCNRTQHHTDEYEQEDLIVRRGTPFFLSFTFQRKVKPDRDLVILQLVTGDRPKQSKSTINRLAVLQPPGSENDKQKRHLWKAKCVEIKEKTIKVEVTPAANVFIGVYEAFLETKNVKDADDTPERYQLPEDFIVIFNPWCKDDVVYMENEDERNEYVLNDTGKIWVGSVAYNRGRPWNFAQFDEPCLDAALTLLKTANLPANGYRNPIAVIRCLTAITNSCDDDGVLEGRWTANYPKNCTVPTSWIGSAAILKEYMETNSPVRYGQCWVFSGVLTTLLRAIGIPTRSVTNFESAHDTDSSMTIDFHFDEDGEPISYLDDSVWNFHVWNESWLRRLDLPPGYDGWQAEDATPQETSGGIMRCGPAPLKAIKEGQVYLLYDIPFIFAEVNGDRVYWVKSEGNEMKIKFIKKSDIGKCISTKMVGSDERNNITHLYKYPEGSDDERRVVKFVNQFSSRVEDDIYDMDIDNEIEFNFVPPSDVEVGKRFELIIFMKSKSELTRNVRVHLTLMTAFYTGVSRQKVKSRKEIVELLPMAELEFCVPVEPQDYEMLLGADVAFSTFIDCKVLDSKECYMNVKKFTLQIPDLVFECPDEVEKAVGGSVTISFTNPLSLNLTNIVLQVEGALIIPPTTFKEPYLPARGKLVKEVSLHPKRRGPRRIFASLVCDQLKGVEGMGRLRVV